MNMKYKMHGFTLIEMMIAVAIIGILFAVAYPSYRSSVMKTQRTDARSELQIYAQMLLRCRSTNTTYDTATGVCPIKDTLATGTVSRGGFYTISVSDLAASTYTLKAVPVSGRSQARDNDCKEFTLDQSGRKAAKNNSNQVTTSTCWP